MFERLKHVDRILLFSIIFLVVGGLFIFLSATLGLLARDGAQFSDVARSQFILGFGGGVIALFVTASLSYRFFRPYSLYIYGAALLLTLLVFVPGLGLELNGARRWLQIGPLTVQPSEFLKIAYILYLASWFSFAKRKVSDIQFGLIPYLAITALSGVALFLQPDGDTFLVIAVTGFAMYVASGARLKHLALLFAAGTLVLLIAFLTMSHVRERIYTFIDPTSDPLGSSYQLQQSLLAIGAGELTGRGFGASIQKFGRLPEPISDSIFSVFAEEFGFIGAVVLVLAFLTFALRGLWIAARSPDLYGGLIAIGVVVAIVFQSYLNIASMLGLVPLSGLPLVFVSHGGTALLSALALSGLLLSVSRSAETV